MISLIENHPNYSLGGMKAKLVMKIGRPGEIAWMEAISRGRSAVTEHLKSLIDEKMELNAANIKDLVFACNKMSWSKSLITKLFEPDNHKIGGQEINCSDKSLIVQYILNGSFLIYPEVVNGKINPTLQKVIVEWMEDRLTKGSQTRSTGKFMEPVLQRFYSERKELSNTPHSTIFSSVIQAFETISRGFEYGDKSKLGKWIKSQFPELQIKANPSRVDIAVQLSTLELYSVDISSAMDSIFRSDASDAVEQMLDCIRR
jgi:hypothetical protein